MRATLQKLMNDPREMYVERYETVFTIQAKSKGYCDQVCRILGACMIGDKRKQIQTSVQC